MLKVIKVVFSICVFSALFFGCDNTNSLDKENEKISMEDTLSEVSSPNENVNIELLAKEYLSYLSQFDFVALEELNKGGQVLFSPYSYLDTSRMLAFSFLEFNSGFSSENQYNWGTFDGTGDPILLSMKNYFTRFVYDVNYLDDSIEMQIGKVPQRGNGLSNIAELYPAAICVEFYQSPRDEELMGMDWRALILVFEMSDDEIILKAIVHNEWTI